MFYVQGVAVPDEADVRINGIQVNTKIYIKAEGASQYELAWEKRKSLERCTWAEISERANSGFPNSYFKIGDTKTVPLTTGEVITLEIVGFNHDDKVSGGKAGITFAMKNLLNTEYKMNATYTNAGGWNNSQMRTSTMSTLLSQLPQDLRNVIVPVKKLTSNGNGSSAIVTSNDSVWLFSEVEISGATSLSYGGEGSRYAFWENGGSTIKNKGGSAGFWWTRSPKTSSNGQFVAVNTSGALYATNAQYGRGVCLGLCV